MTTATEQSASRPSMLAFICERIKENEEFLRSNTRDVEDEIVKLINEAIDNIPHMVEVPEKRDYYVERAMAFFIHHVLMPFSCANYVNLLVSNLPGCFMGLRLMLESLAKCYLADARYSEIPFFQERLQKFDKELQRKRQSISKAMIDLGNELGIGDGFFTLWRKLSQDWLHTAGFANKVVDAYSDEIVHEFRSCRPPVGAKRR